MVERIVDVHGRVMVVTDLHGAWEPYARLRDAFLTMCERGDVDTLVLCGDLIHPEKLEDADASLDMLLDVMRLQQELGRERVVMLLGNHEMPHIYSISLAKGDMVYTPSFEAALATLKGKPTRKQVIDFLAGLPFYARTKAGVLLSHAGAAPALIKGEYVKQLLAFDHHALLKRASEQMEKYGVDQLRAEYERIIRDSYDRVAKGMLAVKGASDPRYNDLLRGVVVSNNFPEFELLWNALFTQNEREGNLKQYAAIVEMFLTRISEISPHEQRVLVAGHIGVKGGCGEVGLQQLRLASYTHAKPRETGRYLVFDSEKPVKRASDLMSGLRLTAGA